MRIFIRLLTTLFLLTALIFPDVCNAAEVIPGAKSLEKVNAKTAEKITAFFLDYLSGKTKIYAENTPIILRDINQEQEVVWKAWQEANRIFNEEKLPPFAKLADDSYGRWNLPAELEPNAIMPFYWGTKGETEPEDGYPLYIYLHGSGNKNSEWATGLTLCQRFNDAPSVYCIPQIPNTGDYYRWWQKAKQYAWEKILRQAFVTGKINPDKVYFFGISEGGYGSQRLASFYADYLAGAGPMAGGEPLINAPVENCRNIAFSLRTGAQDYGFYRNKLTSYTKEEFDRLEKQYPGDFVHHIELVPGMGHGIDYSPMTPWLKQYTRNPYPKSISWENFEMDGQYRKGFYNLSVAERPDIDGKSRTYYEMTIKGNDITLRIDEVTYKTVETEPQWGIQLKCEKNYRPAQKEKVTVYLCPELVDLNKKITLTVNGKKVFEGKVKPELRHIVNSCATFFDPRRLYPAAIEVRPENVK